MFGSNVSEVLFEHFTGTAGTVVRMIAFDTDPEIGAKSVMDIMEYDFKFAANGGRNWLAHQAADYSTWGDFDVVYKFRFTSTDEIADDADVRELADIDTGKCRKLESKIARAMDMMVA